MKSTLTTDYRLLAVPHRPWRLPLHWATRLQAIPDAHCRECGCAIARGEGGLCVRHRPEND